MLHYKKHCDIALFVYYRRHRIGNAEMQKRYKEGAYTLCILLYIVSSYCVAMAHRATMAHSGRGKDIFRLRKQNTSRPPSMHVDDFMAMGVSDIMYCK